MPAVRQIVFQTVDHLISVSRVYINYKFAEIFPLICYKKQIFLGLILTFLTGLTVGTGVAGPMINRVIPFTDPCKWVKYFWPASQEEITAVQEFVRTKASILQKVRRVV